MQCVPHPDSWLAHPEAGYPASQEAVLQGVPTRRSASRPMQTRKRAAWSLTLRKAVSLSV